MSRVEPAAGGSSSGFRRSSESPCEELRSGRQLDWLKRALHKTRWPMLRPPPAPAVRSADGVALLLALAGLAAAACGQAMVVRQPWVSLPGFALGPGLFGWSAWRTRERPDDAPAPPGPLPAAVLALFGLGMGLCGVAGW